MSRLIDADKLKQHYAWWAGGTRETTMDEAKRDFDTIIDVQQTVDAVEVVRCKDCRYQYNCQRRVQIVTRKDNMGTIEFPKLEFCSHGER